MTSTRRLARLSSALRPAAAFTLLLTVAACGDDADPSDPVDAALADVSTDADDALGDDAGDASDTPRGYSATIAWTSFGIPHIEAATWPDAAYGHARAFAQMHACTLADQILKVRGERARWLGAGDDGEHLESDIAARTLEMYTDAEALLPDTDPEIRAMLEAYVAGYNDAIEAIGVDALPAPCTGAPWVQPITATDLLAYYLNLGEFGSGNQLQPFLATAQPPGATKANPVGTSAAYRLTAPDRLPDFRRIGGGSNAWALGRERTESGRGMVLSNSHFPTQGDLQWFESHVTIPGEVDVYGVSLMGVFPINMGFNEHIAWTHTVSPGPRLTGYLLDLERGDPTRYLYDGEPRAMTSKTFEIEVLQADGTIEQVEHTSWYSHFGPILNVPPLGWSRNVVVTYRDANRANDRMAPQWLAMNRATSLEAFRATFRDIGGIPWVHTVAADAEGTAYFIDAASVPALPPAAVEQHQQGMISDPIVQAGAQLGFLLLDGSTSASEWDETADPMRPGLEPADRAPELIRDDFTANSNDNHWLTNPLEPLVGLPYVYGGEGEPQNLPRTRTSLRMLLETGPDSGAGEDGRFSLDELLATAMNGRAIFAELLVDAVVARCEGVTSVDLGGELVDISAICAALAGWEQRLSVDSRGAAAWREFIGAGVFDDDAWRGGGDLYATPFDPADPVETPRGLAPHAGDGADPVLEALALATLALDAAGIAPDARLGDVQYAPRGGVRHERSGGLDRESAFSISDYRGKAYNRDSTLGPGVPRGEVLNADTGLTEEGYVVNAGNSWVAGIAFTDEGPRCRALMTYGQSEDPASPFHADQADRFSRLEWRDCLFDRADIEADPNLRVEPVSREPQP